jgi:parvulin-like peptidyl-prolyl isomerase
MKKIIIVFIGLLLLSISLFADYIYSDKVVAFVNENIITKEQIKTALNQIGWHDVPDDNVRNRILNQLIIDLVKNELLSVESERMQITLPPEMIKSHFNQELNKILNEVGGRENLEKQLSVEGISYEKFASDLEKSIENFLIKQQLFNQKIFSKIVLTKEDLLYRYNVSIILVENPELAKKILLDLRLNNANFSELAKKHSTGPRADEGGNLGYIKIGDLQTELESQILNMFTGDISPIVNTKFGHVIIKLNSKERIDESKITKQELEELKEHFFEAKAASLEKKLYEDLWERNNVNIDYDVLLSIN